MSTVINSINYQFNPDKDTQTLCETICKDIDGNGISLTDISINSSSNKDIIVKTEFNWSVKVTLKSSLMSGKETKQATLHNSALEAQAAAKKQGQYIIQNALGKIELIKNIEEDPEHFYKHSTVKLNGGKPHAFIETCTNNCERGQVTCPRCRGIGTHKAITKKENFLGTTGSFSTINTCPDCKGKGTVDCSNCSGRGEVKRLYTVHVDASRKHSDTTNINEPSVKKTIEKFLSHQSHKDLIKDYLSPVVSELKDIDKDHCSVIYQSKTKYTSLSMTILDKNYTILAFGDRTICIVKPKILDDTLLPAIENIIGISPKISSTSKCKKLQKMPIINLLISTDKKRTSVELESLLNKHSNGLLSNEIAHTIIKKILLIKTSLTPRFSLYAWLPFLLTGMVSGFYFNLKSSTTTDMLITLGIHIILFVAAGYVISKNLTRFKRKKLNLKIDSPTLERIPALLSTTLIVVVTLIPNLLSTEKRWSLFYKADQYINRIANLSESNSEFVSDGNSIRIAKNNLTALGYKNISNDDSYTNKTENAIKDLQSKFGLKETKYIDTATMRVLSKYASIRKNSFSRTKKSQ